MTEKETIEILECMNDGYTFQDCKVCVENNKFNEEKGICESKVCEYLNAINTAIYILKQKGEIIKQKDEMIKKYKSMILEHKQQLARNGIFGYDYDLKLLEDDDIC